MKVLYGGTFDPFHLGHLVAATTVSELLATDIQMVLCARPPHRQPPQASIEDRWKMLSLALVAEPNLVADDREISNPGPSYTVATLESERLNMGSTEPLLWVLGYDSFQSLEHWHRWHEVLELSHLIVLRRPGNYEAESQVIRTIRQARETTVMPTSSHGSVYFVADPMPKISAQEVRERLSQDETVDHLLPNVVASYIGKNNLYGGAH